MEEYDIRKIIKEVSSSMKEMGYNPVTQIVGYLISNDLGYIPDFDDNRNKIAKLDRTLILESMMSELVETSLLSSEQAMQKYIQQPEYQEHMKQVQEQRAILLSRIQEIRKNNPTIELSIAKSTFLYNSSVYFSSRYRKPINL